ncbi:MAG TPA: response regulator, partial [Terriglobia bacterium]
MTHSTETDAGRQDNLPLDARDRIRTVNGNAKVNILLVDDTRANLLALKAILDRPDYNLITATSGQEALGHLLREEFAVVLLDVMMPDMNGFTVATAMKSRERTRYVPIIFVTAIAKESKDVYRGYASGGVDYIQKPFQPEIVRAKVSVFVELFRYRKEIERQAEIIRNSERAQFLEREQDARLRAEAAEQHYYDLINWVDHAVLWEYDASAGKFAFVSKRSAEIFGYSPEDWVKDARFFIERIPVEDREVFEKMVDAAVRLGQDGRCEHRLYRADGSILWVHSGVNPRKDSQGRVTLLWGLTLDITGFKTSEANQRFLAQASAVLSSSLDFSSVIEKITHLIVPNLADWCVVDLAVPGGTPKRIAVAHRSPEKEKWMKDLETKYPLKIGQESPIFSAIESGQPVLWRSVPDSVVASVVQDEAQLQVIRELQMASLMVIPLKVREGVLGTISFVSSSPHRHFTDEDVKLAEELAWHVAFAMDNAQLYQEAKQAAAIREDVLAIVSHDLKNPLSMIGMSAMLLREGKADPRTIGERIHRSVDKMSRLISDLLDMARIEAGQLKVETKPHQAQKL